jgi:23S rRNA-/tRNA-specific pseudouridylate synthase
MAEARTFTISEDDDGIRLDRWFKRHQPEISFNMVSRWARTGQLRLDGKRVAPGERIMAGQQIRVPPAEAEPQQSRPARPKSTTLTAEEIELVRSLVIHEDEHAFVLNKPPGSTACPTSPGTGPSSSTGSTRIRRERCWSPERPAPRRSFPNPSRGERPARSIGRW